MKVTDVKYCRRFKTAEYEFEEYTVSAMIEKGETAIEILNALKSDVLSAYTGESTPPGDDDEHEEEVVTEDTPEDDGEALDPEEDAEEEVEEEPVKPAKKAAAPKKKFKAKAQVYDRNNEAHKELFSGVLRAVAPDWKKTDASKARAKSTSIGMIGSDFLDADGNVLPEFKNEVKKMMKAK